MINFGLNRKKFLEKILLNTGMRLILIRQDEDTCKVFYGQNPNLTTTEKYGYKLENLRMLAKQKFDWHIDPLQLGAKFHEVDKHIDDPIIPNKDIVMKTVSGFFQDQAKLFNREILD